MHSLRLLTYLDDVFNLLLSQDVAGRVAGVDDRNAANFHTLRTGLGKGLPQVVHLIMSKVAKQTYTQ